MKIQNFRQGEVLIFGLDTKGRPREKVRESMARSGYAPKGDNVIAEGEISGHLHAITNGKLYEKDDKIILEADKGCLLTHPEHKPIPIPQGVYEIKIQVEYDEAKHKTKVKD